MGTDYTPRKHINTLRKRCFLRTPQGILTSNEVHPRTKPTPDHGTLRIFQVLNRGMQSLKCNACDLYYLFGGYRLGEGSDLKRNRQTNNRQIENNSKTTTTTNHITTKLTNPNQDQSINTIIPLRNVSHQQQSF